jgi:hypothetical protein
MSEPKPVGRPFVISKRLVWEAWRRVKANRGAEGVDEESIQAFEENLRDNLYKVWNRMSSGSYMPPPVTAVEIPKKKGGSRMLGVLIQLHVPPTATVAHIHPTGGLTTHIQDLEPLPDQRMERMRDQQRTQNSLDDAAV